MRCEECMTAISVSNLLLVREMVVDALRILSKRIVPSYPLPEAVLALSGLVADLILRYALYCPTAVGDALQAVIDMHNFSVEALKRGQDTDGVAFQTAKACIFGLVDLCSAAYSKTTSSPGGRDIRSAVFKLVSECIWSSLRGPEDNVADYYQQQVEMLEGFTEMEELAERGFVPGMLS
ncbi:unnamed protein product [Arabidopsis lyrata]|nr:unnamed protein product [Arabidopsis lyrata]